MVVFMNASKAEFCIIEHEVLDWSREALSRMRVLELKRVLATWGEQCRACLEKTDFIELIQELAPKHSPAQYTAELWGSHHAVPVWGTNTVLKEIFSLNNIEELNICTRCLSYSAETDGILNIKPLNEMKTALKVCRSLIQKSYDLQISF